MPCFPKYSVIMFIKYNPIKFQIQNMYPFSHEKVIWNYFMYEYVIPLPHQKVGVSFNLTNDLEFKYENVSVFCGKALSFNLTNNLEFKYENVFVFCGRALLSLWFLSARMRISLNVR